MVSSGGGWIAPVAPASDDSESVAMVYIEEVALAFSQQAQHQLMEGLDVQETRECRIVAGLFEGGI